MWFELIVKPKDNRPKSGGH